MMAVDRATILDLHRRLVTTPSISKDERACVELAASFLRDHGIDVEFIGRNIVARAGSGAPVLFNTHLDTVPPTKSWTRDPWHVESIDGRVYGLGSNDAKASVVAMMAMLIETARRGGPCEVTLMLVVDEETGGEGTETAWPELRRRGYRPEGVVVGEPTRLDIAVAQKGLLVLEVGAVGDACHAAHAAQRGARNAIYSLARDLSAIERARVGKVDPFLGESTIQPTILQGGTARNLVPDRASAILDIRTVPGSTHDEIIAELRRFISSDLRIISKRLEPRACPGSAAIVRAATSARPNALLIGSATMSDMVFFGDVPVIKCGPGDTTRSHQPDEFVLESEILEGAEFYDALVRSFADFNRSESGRAETVGER